MSIRRDLPCDEGVEPTIGHMTADGDIARIFLPGIADDAIATIPATVGRSLRLLRRRLARLLALSLAIAAMLPAARNLRSGLSTPRDGHRSRPMNYLMLSRQR